MALSIDTVGRDQLKVRIVPSPNFDKDRERIKTIPGKKPIYKFDTSVAKDVFQYWEIPRTEVGSICAKFDLSELLLMSPKVKEQFERFVNLRTPLDQLPPITRLIDWRGRPPRFPEQEVYIRSSEDRNRLICALAPGLGKSHCALKRAELLGFEQLLIVCPKTVMVNWRSEIYKSLGIETLIYHGTIKQREKLKEKLDDARIVITSYSMLEEVNDMVVDQIILDEAHILSHSSTKAWKAARKLVEWNHGAGIQLLTGTPILHKPKDLWGLVWLIYPEIAGDYWAWKNKYEEVIKSFKKRIPRKDKSGRVLRDPDTGEVLTREIEIPLVVRNRNLDELRERVSPFLMRVKRDGLVNWVDAVDTITVAMLPRQRSLYNKIVENVLLNLENGDLNIPNALSELTRLLQVSEGAYNIPQAGFQDSGKLDFIREDIKNNPDEPTCYWFRFKPGTLILGEEFKDTAVMFNGDMTQNQKTLALWSFQGVDNEQDEREFHRLAKSCKWRFGPGEAQQLFGVIDKSSTLGFNLPRSHRQFFPSFAWNGNTNEQTADRIKRLDQLASEVFTTIILSENSIDEIALEMVLNNLKTCLHVLDGIGDPTYSQIKELIKKLRQEHKHHEKI